VRYDDLEILLAPLVNRENRVPDPGGERMEFPAHKDPAVAVASLGLAGWDLVNADGNMWYFKREKLPEEVSSPERPAL
jgi:hypothetical protein